MQLKVIEDGKANTKSPWYAEGLSFTCTQCGNCCTGAPGVVWISDVEVGRLAKHLKLTRKEILERYCRKVGARYSLKENRSPRGEYDCIFLKEERTTRRAPDGTAVAHTKRSCTVYPVRPLQCRTWPFWDGNLMSKDAWKASSRRCPGMDTGRKYTREQIEALRDAPDWPDAPPTSG